MNQPVMPLLFPVTAHTQHVGPGSSFVAIKGFSQDGAGHIPEALKRGAHTIVVETGTLLSPETIACINDHNATLVSVPNTRSALAQLSAHAAGNPAQHLKIIGITGTKGKTTSTFLLEHILHNSGIKTARITGVTNRINGYEMPACLTTPQPDYLHQFFKLCVEQGVTHVVMEVAAQALSLDRVHTVVFDGIIFTNIAREHLEFYATMEEYFATKCRIFEHTTEQSICLVNSDDPQCAMLVQHFPSAVSYGFNKNGMIQAQTVDTQCALIVDLEGNKFTCPSLIGHYNAQNLLGICIMALKLGLSAEKINTALATFGSIPGRMEKYLLPNQALCIIDYAHNPSSYAALLSTLRPLTDHLIVIFGASGTRDKGKRPLMGAQAAAYADLIILTTDNPGPEDPFTIMHDIAAGIPAAAQCVIIKEPDRARAIEIGYAQSRKNSIIALLGKGPDEYQVIQGIKYRFSERELVQSLL
jgi:UDP-N-acetylmuramoyl-L-alanyl-D-glutamate--2,6-diaminopimelate ligase